MARRKRKEKVHHQGIRPFWSGTISFALVSVPVHLFSGTRRGGVSLRLLTEDGTPLRRHYFCPEHARDVHPEHLLRGYEVSDGEYVIVTDEELESLAPRKSKDIDLTRFVDRSELPPLFFERPYFLTPAGDSTKAYRLMADVLERKNRAGIATFVMRGHEYLVAIIAQNGILQAELLRFSDEIRDPSDVGLPEVETASKQTVTKFKQAIQKNTSKTLRLDEIQDEYSIALKELVEKKRKRGEGVVEAGEIPESDAEPEDEVEDVDLLETIRSALKMRQGTVRQPKARSRERTSKRTAKTKPTLKTQSREELYDRAKKLDIPGRSEMTKKQLISALRRR